MSLSTVTGTSGASRRHGPGLFAATLAILVAASMSTAVAAAGRAPAPPVDTTASMAPTTDAMDDADASPSALLAQRAELPARSRVTDSVARLARSHPSQRLPMIIVSARPLPAGAVPAESKRWTWPGGEHLTLARVPAGDAARLAALPGVARIMDGRPGMSAKRRDEGVAKVGGAGGVGRVGVGAERTASPGKLASGVTRRDATAGTDAANAIDSPQSRADRPQPKGWWDVGLGHGGRDAWDMGFRGEGVTAAVLDTGVDFGHPDLKGAWAVYPAGHPYAGWPEAFDPDGMVNYLSDETDDESEPMATADGEGGVIALYQTSEVTEVDNGGEVAYTACFTPLMITDGPDGIERNQGEEDCDTVVPKSAGGVLRYGHHPDTVLGLTIGILQDLDANEGELPGVLAVDSTTPGVYDTVYIDLNGDHDFTDDVALDRDHPLATWDADADGVADVSGGLLTFIADGQRPVPGSYLVGLEDTIPAAGSLVALLYESESHGTACASDIVSRGVMPPPPGTEMAYSDLPGGKPAAVNPALAPGAHLIGMGDVYAGDIHFDLGWRFAALGADPEREDDDAQVVSNSFGVSDPDDGWDGESRVIDWYVRHLAPETLFLVATGNAGPGYGSTSAPSPGTGIDVGASDQFGAQSSSTIRNTSQITYGDLIPFANRGPGASGRPGVGITANGDIGWGALPLNQVAEGVAAGTGNVAGSGQAAQEPWGGTSRSTPVASAVAVLAYQAFKAKHDRWPSAEEAKALVFAGARFNGYDVFSTGAGTVDAGDSARIASGKGGLYAVPPQWTAGDWHGTDFGGFAHVLPPGGAAQQTFKVSNAGAAPITARVRGARLVRTSDYDTTHLMKRSLESRGADSVVPDWLFAIDKSTIPADTDLIVIRGAMPNDQARVMQAANGRISANEFDMGIIRHTDLDGDGLLWHDDNANGAVNHAGRQDQVDWTKSEVDAGEFNRTTFHYGPMNGWAVTMHHPLQRWGDGLYVGLWHSGPVESVTEAAIQIRIETYAWRDWSWLSAGDTALTVPAGGGAELSAGVTVPANAPTGLYEGAIFLDYDRADGDAPVPTGGGYELPQKRVVIPVVVNVAPNVDWTAPVTLGGEAAAAVDEDAAYRQGTLYGLSDYSSAESGDWRFFFLDAPDPGPDRWWLLHTAWGGEIGQSHVGTGLFGPTPDRFTDPSDRDNADESRVDTPWYGPYKLGELARTANAFDVVAPNNGPEGNDEWLASRAAEGLHEVMVHSVYIDGYDVTLPFTTTVGSIRVNPPEILLRGSACADVEIESTLAVDDVRTLAGGLSKPETLAAQPIDASQDDTKPVTIVRRFAQPVLRLAIDLEGNEGDDLDLRVFYDTNRNGKADPNELIGASESPTAEESFALSEQGDPGTYIIQVIAFALAGDARTYDLTIDAVSGDDVYATDGPAALGADEPTTLHICPAPDIADRAGAKTGGVGLLTLGPAEAPGIVRVPVRWAPEGGAMVGIYLPVVMRGFERP
ncbi:MAG: S8 family serine peptidase [Ardenticatenales bacterium]